MYGHVSSGRAPVAEPIVDVLGYQLSQGARRFASEYADFIVRMDFEDIADHPLEYIRSAEAHCSSDGVRHTIWLDKESSHFEGLMMHQVMRAILMEQGYPRTTCAAGSHSYAHHLFLSSLLSSAVTDPIIDSSLFREGYEVYDRQELIRRTMEQVWVDAQQGTPKEFEFHFCKWTLLTVLMRLDFTFEGENARLLFALIRKKFPEPWRLGDELSASIKKQGFREPHQALMAVLKLRDSLRLQGIVGVIDAEGICL